MPGKTIFILSLLFLSFKVRSQFQATPVKDSIQSVVLGEQRDIRIILPTNYATDTAALDVWYAVDGEWDNRTTTDIFNYLVAIGFVPPVIIVRLPNRIVNGFNLRNRDLTPTRWKDVDSSGGADRFLDFIEQELMPYIRKKYRTTGEAALVGSSFGGMFAIYSMLKRPSLFRFYITGDPALHFDDNFVPQLAARTIGQIPFSNTVLNIGGRSGSSYHAMGRDMMDSILRTTAPPGLHWHSALYDNETHASSVFKSIYDGIKFAYLGYAVRNAQLQLTSGIVLKDRPIRLFIPTDYADMHYTTNGQEPTSSDPKADEFLLVSEPEKLIVKSLSPSGRHDHLLPVRLRSGDYLLPKKSVAKKMPANKLDSNFKPDGSGLMNGVVNIPNDGYYVMQLTPSTGTKLYFNDSLFVHANAAIGHARQTIILPLRKGNYWLRLEHPSKDPADPSLRFGFYASANGQDDWWRNPMVRW